MFLKSDPSVDAVLLFLTTEMVVANFSCNLILKLIPKHIDIRTIWPGMCELSSSNFRIPKKSDLSILCLASLSLLQCTDPMISSCPVKKLD